MEHNHLQPRWLALEHNFQQLPLELKPIKLVSNTHLSFVIIELFKFDCSNQWVSQVLLLIDLPKVDFISILSNKVIAMQKLFGS